MSKFLKLLKSFLTISDLDRITKINNKKKNSYLNSFNFSTLPNDYDPGNWESVGHGNFVQGTGWSGGIGRLNCIEFSSNGSDCFHFRS